MKTDTEHLQNPGKHKADFQYTIVGEAKQKMRVSFWRDSFHVQLESSIRSHSQQLVGSGSRNFGLSRHQRKANGWMEKFEAEIFNLNLTVIYNWHMRCVFKK